MSMDSYIPDFDSEVRQFNQYIWVGCTAKGRGGYRHPCSCTSSKKQGMVHDVNSCIFTACEWGSRGGIYIIHFWLCVQNPRN